MKRNVNWRHKIVKRATNEKFRICLDKFKYVYDMPSAMSVQLTL